MIVYFAEEGDLSMLLRDAAKKPSFEWGETFATLMNNKIKIYNNEDFEISKGFCTPISKPTCTPKRKALAMTFKKMAKNK